VQSEDSQRTEVTTVNITLVGGTQSTCLGVRATRVRDIIAVEWHHVAEDVCAGTKTSPAAQSFMLISAAVGQVIGILLYFALFPLIFCLAPGITAVVILESIVILIVIHYT